TPSTQVRATTTLDTICLHLHDELAEARAHFPTPPPGRLSPDSLDLGELDLAPSTAIRAMESSGEDVATGSTPNSQSAPGGEEEGAATAKAEVRFDRCGAAW